MKTTKAELERELVGVRADLDGAKARAEAFIGEIQQLRERVAALNEKDVLLSASLAKAETAEAAAKARVTELEAELATARGPRPRATTKEAAERHREFLENVPPPGPDDYRGGRR